MPNIKPILFNTDMVRALLENRKTVTRRVMKPQPADTDCEHEMVTYDQMLPEFYKGDYSCVCRKCGYGAQPNGESVFQSPYCPNDILYVRETWREWVGGYSYRADAPEWACQWRPSIHMPREAARIFLQVKDVRVERLQDISEAEILQDTGEVECTDGYDYFKDEFKVVPYSEKFKFLLRAVWGRFWDKHIVKMREGYTWDTNPWVFVISFERISKEEAEKNA